MTLPTFKLLSSRRSSGNRMGLGVIEVAPVIFGLDSILEMEWEDGPVQARIVLPPVRL